MDKSLTPIFLFAAFLLGTARWMPRWALIRPALVAVLTAGLLAWCGIALRRLPVELMPNAASETVSVTISVRGGMAPNDVETSIVRPLEEVFGDLPRLQTLYGSAKKDRATLTLLFEPGVDMRRTTAYVHERVDRALPQLPPEIEKPVIAHFEESDAPVYIAALTSEHLNPEALRRVVDEKITDRLLRVSGVANVEVGGGRESKILIELDKDRLLAYRLSVHRIAALLGRRNVAVQVGGIEDAQRGTPVRLVGTFRTLEDMKKIVVGRAPGGGGVLLEQVARVSDDYLEPESLSRLNGRSAVSIYVQKESAANTLNVANGVEKALNDAWRDFPGPLRKQITKVVVSNQATGIRASMASVRVSLVLGILLILLALCLFESHHVFTKRLAAISLAGLLAVILTVSILKISEAKMEIPYLLLLGAFLALAAVDPDFRPGFIVAGSMPFSAVFCFILFQLCGMTINVMSLFGLALGLGMLVDNATVIFERITHGGPLPPDRPGRIARALEAAQSMVLPLIGATVTNAIVFVPFLFLSPDIQKTYTDVAAAVGASLFASLAISLTAVPLLSVFVSVSGPPARTRFHRAVEPFLNALWARAQQGGEALIRFLGDFRSRLWARVKSRKPPEWAPHTPAQWFGVFLFLVFAFWVTGWVGGSKTAYGLGIAFVTAVGFYGLSQYETHWDSFFGRRWQVLAGVVLLAGVGAALLVGATERDFQTSGEQDEFVIFVELSSGVQLSVSNAVVRDIEKTIESHPWVGPEVETLVSRVEGWSSKVYVTLKPRADRRLSTEAVMNLLRDDLKHTGKDKDGNAFVHFSSPRQGQEITVQVMGPDYGVLESLAQKICADLGSIKGLDDVKMRYRPGRPEVVVQVQPDKAARLGFTAETVAETAHALLRGVRATTFRTQGLQKETIVRLQPSDRADLDAVADVPLLNRNGEPARLGQVADLLMSKMPNEIFRQNKERLIQITANRSGLSLGRAAEEIQARLDKMSFPLEYHAALEGDVEDMRRGLQQLTGGILVMVVLVYLVLVVLFESLLEPFIIMTTVPLSLIGVVWGLILFDIPLSLGVLVGLLMLGGVVVNNAIMLIDEFNSPESRESGRPLEERLKQAAASRLRPILLTVGSAVLGFLPMMLDMSENGVLWRPLAIAMVFGLLTSTVLTLYVVPCLSQTLLGDLPNKLNRK